MAFLVVMLTNCDKKKDSTKQATKEPPIVDVLIAQPSKIEDIFEANGSVVANESAELRPEISGRLVYLDMPDGEQVSKGAVLARVNDEDLQAQLAKVNVQLDLASKTEDRLKKLLAVNGASQAEYDLALNQLNGFKADAVILQSQIDKTVVKAPFDGKLGIRTVSPGTYVTPQTLLGIIQQVDKLKIDFTVPEDYIGLVRIGNEVKVFVNNGKTSRNARISAIEPQLNLTTRNLKVRAILSGAGITPGTFVKLLLPFGTEQERFIVPTNAIIPDATAKKLVIIRNDSARFVPVETGGRTAVGVEIIKGIEIGDSIIVTGTLFVRPNQRVKVRSIKTLESLLK